MPATAPELSRRAVILGCLAACARAADASQEAWELVATMAAALGTGDAGEFLAACDAAMPGYPTLRRNVAALVAQSDVESAVDPMRNTGDEHVRDVAVDWQLRLVDRTGLNRVTDRRHTVTLRLEKRGRQWKVVALDPVAFFTPASA